jgi:phosphopantothenoylcysteine decarboxylase / phosphopantothenate---cysteine ligase
MPAEMVKHFFISSKGLRKAGNTMLKDKQIVVGVTGGIAAYKSCELVSRLVKQGAHVNVIMTEAATSFVNPLTFQALSRNVVVTTLFQSIKYWEIEHISLSQKADLIVIAPATANIIGKTAAGIADDFLTTVIMAATVPIYFAPAMNTKMFENPILQSNMKTLKELGYRFIDPCEGLLACGDTGTGKMAEPEQIEQIIIEQFNQNQLLKGVPVLITAGPTQEAIDPVRYLTNHSSGKMGYALAKAAVLSGAEVTLVSGPVHLAPPAGCRMYNVKTAGEMYDCVMALYDEQQIVIKAAAVADYRPAEINPRKIKKNNEQMSIQLIKNPDILYELGVRKKHQMLVGFAAETDNLMEYAELKLKQKNLDMIIANDVSLKDTGFLHDTNQVVILDRLGETKEIALSHKETLAVEIIRHIANAWNLR